MLCIRSKPFTCLFQQEGLDLLGVTDVDIYELPNFKYSGVESQKRHNTPTGCVYQISIQTVIWCGHIGFI
jgi:hypothetical protein